MKILSTITMGAEAILLLASLSLGASAQLGVRGGKGAAQGNLANDIRPTPSVGGKVSLGHHAPNLANDVHQDPYFGDASLQNDIRRSVGHGAQYTGPILDGGSVFVDLGGSEELSIAIETWKIDEDPQGVRPPREHKRLRLFGGAPGDAGALMVSLRAPAPKAKLLGDDALVFSGAFSIDGSLEVELPALDGEVFVQGIDVTRLGGATSAIFQLTPPGLELTRFEGSWDAEAISAAVKRANMGLADERVSLHFFGAARMGALDGSVDISVTLGRSTVGGRKSFDLYLDAGLAQRTALANLEDGGALFHLRSLDEQIDAISTVATLAAFSGGPTITLPQLNPGKSAQLAPTRMRNGGSVSAYPAQRATAVVAGTDTLGKLADPQRAGKKPAGPHTGQFNGTVGDAGSVMVDNGAQDVTATVAGTDTLGKLADPLRAGKKPAGPHTGQFNGTVGDAGSVMVDNPAESDTAIVGGTDTLGKLADPQRAGNKGPAAPRSGRFTGSIGDAGSRGVYPPAPQDVDSGYYRKHPAASFENVQRKLDLLRSRLSLRGEHMTR